VLCTSTFTEMRRLARDETPFPLAMQPKVTAPAWLPDGGNVILLGTHEPNRLARDETPYPLTRSFLLFSGSLLFLAERPFIAFSEILGRNILRFYC
jgi:hypothetical protein